MSSIEKRKRIIVHCFGASLTEGLTWFGNRQGFAPYSTYLDDIFFSPKNEPQLNTHFEFHFRNHGISGEQTHEIRERFEQCQRDGHFLKPESTATRDEEIFIFLAGTNDLGWGKEPRVPFGNIQAMVLSCVTQNRRTIVCSIPATAEVEGGSKDRILINRVKFNKMLEDLATELGPTKCLFYDLHRDSGVEVKEEENNCCCYIKLNPKLAADNIHLTPEGYQLLARGVAEKIKVFLTQMMETSKI
jgi:lysophospholipase L1-like esterase